MRNIIDQMIHDISGKAMVLSIMNELHSNKDTQRSIDELINYILKYRKEISENSEIDQKLGDWIIYLNNLIDNLIIKSENIMLVTSDKDIEAAINSLVNLSIGYKSLLNDNIDINNLGKLSREKSINMGQISNFKDIICGLLLVLKENCEISCEDDYVIISNINYNIFRSQNGVLAFLLKKYNFTDEFNVNKSELKIKCEIKN